ncbi:MAG: hypothetical protein JNM10_02205 [Planctomycetia bacterium]|nr:hypothetical protein [Planctomycetia bacterium]
MRTLRRLALLALAALASLPLTACGGSGGGDGPGIVGRLTGDPDDEVSPQLQSLVEKALDRGETDAPIDD